MIDVAVVGGGLCGLAAALALTRQGLAVRVLEATGRLGGVVRTHREDGFLLEGGPDALLAQKPAALELCRSLGLGPRLVPTNPDVRTVFVLRKGRLHRMPEGMVLGVPTRLGPLARSGLFSWPGKIRMGVDLLRPARRDGRDESIADFFRRRLGAEALERLGEPLLAGIHAGDPERLSMQACFPRFVEMEKHEGSLIRGLVRARRSTPEGPPFWSLAGGLGELVEALTSALPAASINKDAPVTAVERQGDAFTIRTPTATLSARAVVAAIPPHAAARLLVHLAPGAAESLQALRAADTAVVLLGYRREDVTHPLDGYGLLVPRSEGLRTTACGFFSTKFPGRAPPGQVLLRGFLGGARDPDILGLDDEALVATATSDLGPVLGLAKPPVLARVFRWPQATPQLEVGHAERMSTLEGQLAGTPGLFVTGAGLRATGIPDCVADATSTAARAASFLGRSSAAILGP